MFLIRITFAPLEIPFNIVFVMMGHSIPLVLSSLCFYTSLISNWIWGGGGVFKLNQTDFRYLLMLSFFGFYCIVFVPCNLQRVMLDLVDRFSQ